MEMIQTDGLVYQYSRGTETRPEKITALDGVNLRVQKGEFVAILGRNGSGKSTLVKHINALLIPTSGTVWVKGRDTGIDENIWYVRQTAGMVFQNPDNQIIATIVEEDVAFGPENLGVDPAEIRRRVKESIASVHMSEYLLAAPHNLSGGQKQRVAIAGALAMKPDCILLDEPTAMLDPSGRKEVIETILRLNREESLTVILITHFMEEAVQADRVVVMDQGKIMLDSVPRDVFQRVDDMKRYGLDVPQATELAYALNLRGAALPEDLLTMDDLADAFLSLKPPEGMPQLPAEDTPKSGETSESILEIENVTFIYNQGSAFEKKALDGINLRVKSGEFIGLIGHTGSGKSTLIQHLNALLKPTAGRVLLNGEDFAIDKSKLKSVRQRVGLVFQYPEHQLFEMTVFKDVAFGPENMGLPTKEVQKRVENALTTVGIDKDLYETSPFDLSGGQKRRVAIAGVLAMEPEVLILDEPTAGLDPRGRDEILAQIRDMHQERHMTIILVSHSMEDVASLAERVIVMDRGRIALHGTPSEVFLHVDELENMGLSAPQIAILSSRLRAAGWPIAANLFTPQAALDALTPYLRRTSC